MTSNPALAFKPTAESAAFPGNPIDFGAFFSLSKRHTAFMLMNKVSHQAQMVFHLSPEIDFLDFFLILDPCILLDVIFSVFLKGSIFFKATQ